MYRGSPRRRYPGWSVLQNRASVILRFVEQTVVLFDFFHQHMEYLCNIFARLARTLQIRHAHRFSQRLCVLSSPCHHRHANYNNIQTKVRALRVESSRVEACREGRKVTVSNRKHCISRRSKSTVSTNRDYAHAHTHLHANLSLMSEILHTPDKNTGNILCVAQGI